LNQEPPENESRELSLCQPTLTKILGEGEVEAAPKGTFKAVTIKFFETFKAKYYESLAEELLNANKVMVAKCL
jgi:hypothetical protein